MHNFGIFYFQDVNAIFKGPMVLALSRQEIVSVGLDTMEKPVMKEKSQKVRLNAIIYVKTTAKYILLLLFFLSFQIFLPTPNVKVLVVLKGHNSDPGWMTVCRILSHKKFGATLKV